MDFKPQINFLLNFPTFSDVSRRFSWMKILWLESCPKKAMMSFILLPDNNKFINSLACPVGLHPGWLHVEYHYLQPLLYVPHQWVGIHEVLPPKPVMRRGALGVLPLRLIGFPNPQPKGKLCWSDFTKGIPSLKYLPHLPWKKVHSFQGGTKGKMLKNCQNYILVFEFFPLVPPWKLWKKSCLKELKFCEVSEYCKSSICWNFQLSVSFREVRNPHSQYNLGRSWTSPFKV